MLIYRQTYSLINQPEPYWQLGVGETMSEKQKYPEIFGSQWNG